MWILLLYAALNAILYSTLLPLWEGFDEPFHFAYVQQLANGQGFPDARKAFLSREVWESIVRAPASDPVKVNLPAVFTYSDYFSWPPDRRVAMRESLETLPPDTRWQASDAGNYEAQHAPLAYIVLAPIERMLSWIHLPGRVLILRLLAALAGSALLCGAITSLGVELSLPPSHRDLVLFGVLSSQMTWAALAHVANDWLAVPLAVWSLVFLLRNVRSPGHTNLVFASLLLSAGLLTKAYFLALVPVLAVVAVISGKWRALLTASSIVTICAGPWYLRNWQLYHAATGMQEERAGIGFWKAFSALPSIHWPSVIASTVRGALWTGNNTFRNFSLHTMNFLVCLCVAGLILWALSRHRRGEWLVLAYCAAFAAALAYVVAISFVRTGDPSVTPSPWYAQVLVAPMIVLVVLGTVRWGIAGKILGSAIALVFGYVLAATYIFKLIPLYSGYQGRGDVRDIASLYANNLGSLAANLNSVSLGPAWFIFTTTLAVLAVLCLLELRLLSALWAAESPHPAANSIRPS